jgi:DNA-directed RNA polymerase subunit RPC12/RpoP
MSYDLVTVARYDSSIQAHIVKAHLEGHDMVCFVFDDHMVDMYALYSNAIGGVKIKVREKDAEAAHAIIQELEKKPYTDQNDEVIACPNCDSTEYYKDFNSMRSFGSILSALASMVIWVSPIYRKRVYRCKKCNTEFDPKLANADPLD